MIKRIILFCNLTLSILSFPLHSAQIIGNVQDEYGYPVPDAVVFVYGTDHYGFSNGYGAYTIDGITPASPRYMVWVEKEGYLTARAGNLDVSESTPTVVDFVLEARDSSNSYKTQALDVRIVFLIYHETMREVIEPYPVSVMDSTLFPEAVRPYLHAGMYMDPDHPAMQGIAAEVLASIPESLHTNATEVAKAAYLWAVTHLDYDLMQRHEGDVTCNNWQTCYGAWGYNFADWCYLPEEMAEVRRGICIELERFSATLVRALGIPARSAPLGAHPVTQWWCQAPSGEGFWANFETSWGIVYAEAGDTFRYFPSKGDNHIAFVPINSGAPIHIDWNFDNPSLWIEANGLCAGSVKFPGDEGGYLEALAAYQFSAEQGTSMLEDPFYTDTSYYETFMRILTVVDLAQLGDQTEFITRNQLFGSPVYGHTVKCTIWTSHPGWLEETFRDTVSDATTGESNAWLNNRFRVTPLPITDGGFFNGDMEAVAGALPSGWHPILVPPTDGEVVSSDTSFLGAHSAMLHRTLPGIAALRQGIPIRPDDVIKVEGWVKGSEIEGPPGGDAYVGFSIAFSGTPPDDWTFPRVPEGTFGWMKVWMSWRVPEGADTAYIHLTLNGAGTVYFDQIKVTAAQGGPTGISEISSIKPEKMDLHVYPNPFNSSVNIRIQGIDPDFSREKEQEVEIYDINGRLVLRSTLTPLTKGGKYEGVHSREVPPLVRGVRGDLSWQPEKSTSSGVYLVRVIQGEKSITRKMVYLK